MSNDSVDQVGPIEEAPMVGAPAKVTPVTAVAKRRYRRAGEWLLTLGLVGTASIVLPSHLSYSVPSARPSATATQRPLPLNVVTPTAPSVSMFVAPLRTTVVTRPTTFTTTDRSVRCVLVPSRTNTRVDCQLTTPAVVRGARNAACESWGSSVRLVGSARLTCSAPLPSHSRIVLPTRARLTTHDVSCITGPSGLRCVQAANGAGFAMTKKRVNLIPAFRSPVM